MRVKFYRTRKLRKAALFSFVSTLMVSGFVTLPVAQAPQGHSWSSREKVAGGSTVSDDQFAKKRVRLSQKEDLGDSHHKKEEAPADRKPDDRLAKLDSPERSPSGAVPIYRTTQPQTSQPAKKNKPDKARTDPTQPGIPPGKDEPVPDDSKPDDGAEPEEPPSNEPHPIPPGGDTPPDPEEPEPEPPGEEPEEPEQGNGDHSKPECFFKPVPGDGKTME
ncbi:hypothetical protein GCM10007416_31270 [Kroppenstedtia guangzhouensis]|uniref:Uncharacterized protein n=1 Tax=Kroppenstedtia guangzhouensis TaxID=1274356 RepID=A0ABQ1H1R7_9BACL|nr:hypothetical protein [Kroppenstedtia guangzhouensis]GGA55810.1 hypothetical protein GCM10007416_31270 [Kroppenstedtia guangzhouensis]